MYSYHYFVILPQLGMLFYLLIHDTFEDNMSKNSKFKRDAKKNTERKKQNRKNDKIIRRKMLVPNIYFDESGNTG